MTRWTIAHRRLVLIAWIVVVAGLFSVAQSVGKRTDSGFSLPHTDSGRALDLLAQRFPAQAGDTDQVVFRATTGRLTDPANHVSIDRALAAIAGLPHVTSVISPFEAGASALSASRTIGFASVSFDAPPDKIPTAAVKAVQRAADAARTPTLEVEMGGRAIEKVQSFSGFASSSVGLVAAIVVLLISFGSLLAMALPIITAVLGLGAAVATIDLVSHAVSMADFSTELALMIGLGVGIDYALFIVTRFRTTFQSNGGEAEPAIEIAMRTAGRAVVIAGLTVVISILTLLALGMPSLSGAAVASAIAVLLVLVASLTLLPALLALTGARVGAPRPRAGREETGRPGRWVRWVALVQQRRMVAVVASTFALLALALPLLGLRLGNSDAGNDRPDQTTRKAYDLLAEGFGPGFNGPVLVVVAFRTATDSAATAGIVDALRRVPDVATVAAPRFNNAHDTAAIALYPRSASQTEATEDLVKHLRADVLPQLTAPTHAAAYLGGVTPVEVDLAIVVTGKLPWLIGTIVVLSALLLLVAFRSLVVPLQAAVMNLLSIGAALGLVQAVFERGWFSWLLGVEPAPISPYIPVMLFAVVFGLSMDYEVFLVSRVREEWERTGDPSVAVREGVASTGRVVTAAAAVMIAVFGAFAASSNLIVKVFGFAMAIAIFLDAIVIRTVLLPAVLEMTGRLTWWLPKRLDAWIPRLAIEAPPTSAMEEAVR
ncbi:MAG TPA: MMPL family transporter [Mycobacteriales bacterium]|nr:MMPL family transporter [Mycobacteriales bacterium]